MKSISLYRKYREIGFSRRTCFKLSNMSSSIFSFFVLLFFIAFCYYFYSFILYEKERIEKRVIAEREQELADSLELNRKLSKYLNTCLDENKEGAIWIGDKLYLCSIVFTGERR